MGKDEQQYEPNSVNAVLARIESKIDQLGTNSQDHGNRITSLERWRWYLGGGLLVSIGAGGWYLAQVSNHVFKP